MAQLIERLARNVPGRFYVDSTCIDCDQCRSLAPDFFVRDDELGFSVVQRQPSTVDEIALAAEALEICPSQSIGNDASG